MSYLNKQFKSSRFSGTVTGKPCSIGGCSNLIEPGFSRRCLFCKERNVRQGLPDEPAVFNFICSKHYNGKDHLGNLFKCVHCDEDDRILLLTTISPLRKKTKGLRSLVEKLDSMTSAVKEIRLTKSPIPYISPFRKKSQTKKAGVEYKAESSTSAVKASFHMTKSLSTIDKVVKSSSQPGTPVQSKVRGTIKTPEAPIPRSPHSTLSLSNLPSRSIPLVTAGSASPLTTIAFGKSSNSRSLMSPSTPEKQISISSSTRNVALLVSPLVERKRVKTESVLVQPGQPPERIITQTPTAFLICSCLAGEVACVFNTYVRETMAKVPRPKDGEKEKLKSSVFKGQKAFYIICDNSSSELCCQNKISSQCFEQLSINPKRNEQYEILDPSKCYDCTYLCPTEDINIESEGVMQVDDNILPAGLVLPYLGYLGDDFGQVLKGTSTGINETALLETTNSLSITDDDNLQTSPKPFSDKDTTTPNTKKDSDQPITTSNETTDPGMKSASANVTSQSNKVTSLIDLTLSPIISRSSTTDQSSISHNNSSQFSKSPSFQQNSESYFQCSISECKRDFNEVHCVNCLSVFKNKYYFCTYHEDHSFHFEKLAAQLEYQLSYKSTGDDIPCNIVGCDNETVGTYCGSCFKSLKFQKQKLYFCEDHYNHHSWHTDFDHHGHMHGLSGENNSTTCLECGTDIEESSLNDERNDFSLCNSCFERSSEFTRVNESNNELAASINMNSSSFENTTGNNNGESSIADCYVDHEEVEIAIIENAYANSNYSCIRCGQLMERLINYPTIKTVIIQPDDVELCPQCYSETIGNFSNFNTETTYENDNTVKMNCDDNISEHIDKISSHPIKSVRTFESEETKFEKLYSVPHLDRRQYPIHINTAKEENNDVDFKPKPVEVPDAEQFPGSYDFSLAFPGLPTSLQVDEQGFLMMRNEIRAKLKWSLNKKDVNIVSINGEYHFYILHKFSLGNLLAPSERKNPYYSEVYDGSKPHYFAKYNWVYLGAVFRSGVKNYGDGLPWLAMCALLHPRYRHRFILVAIDCSTCRKPITGFTIFDSDFLASDQFDGFYILRTDNSNDLSFLNEFVGCDPSQPFDEAAVTFRYIHFCRNHKIIYDPERGITLVSKFYEVSNLDRQLVPISEQFQVEKGDPTYEQWYGNSSNVTFKTKPNNATSTFLSEIETDNIKQRFSSRLMESAEEKKKLEDIQTRLLQEEKAAKEKIAEETRIAREVSDELNRRAREEQLEKERQDKEKRLEKERQDREKRLAEETLKKEKRAEEEKRKKEKKLADAEIDKKKKEQRLYDDKQKKLLEQAEKELADIKRLKAQLVKEIEESRRLDETINDEIIDKSFPGEVNNEKKGRNNTIKLTRSSSNRVQIDDATEVLVFDPNVSLDDQTLAPQVRYLKSHSIPITTSKNKKPSKQKDKSKKYVSANMQFPWTNSVNDQPPPLMVNMVTSTSLAGNNNDPNESRVSSVSSSSSPTHQFEQQQSESLQNATIDAKVKAAVDYHISKQNVDVSEDLRRKQLERNEEMKMETEKLNADYNTALIRQNSELTRQNGELTRHNNSNYQQQMSNTYPPYPAYPFSSMMPNFPPIMSPATLTSSSASYNNIPNTGIPIMPHPVMTPIPTPQSVNIPTSIGVPSMQHSQPSYMYVNNFSQNGGPPQSNGFLPVAPQYGLGPGSNINPHYPAGYPYYPSAPYNNQSYQPYPR